MFFVGSTLCHSKRVETYDASETNSSMSAIVSRVSLLNPAGWLERLPEGKPYSGG